MGYNTVLVAHNVGKIDSNDIRISILMILEYQIRFNNYNIRKSIVSNLAVITGLNDNSSGFSRQTTMMYRHAN